MTPPLDEDAMVAAVDLVGRTGAKDLTVGYLHDDVPPEDASWWAHAQYRGARITVEGHRDPVDALDALCMRLLAGGQCQHCGGLVTLSDAGVQPADRYLANGAFWSKAAAARSPECRWRREGRRWVRGCEGERP